MMAVANEILFACREDFRAWLISNCKENTGVWLTFDKTGKVQTIKPDEALAEALCFGWIDGQIKSVDENNYLKKFTPRRKGSKWSERNRMIAEELIAQGSMAEPGYAAITRAKQDGTWDVPKPPPITDEQVEILLKAVKGHEPAFTNLQKMPPSVRRTYTAHYLSAKTDGTRASRLAQIIGRLDENKRPM